MFKKLLFAALVALMAASCSKNSIPTAPVTVNVENFRITIDTFSDTKSAVDPASYTYVSALDLAFYNGDTQVFKATQIKGDNTYTTFGQFSCSLPIGTYTLVAIGRANFEGDEFSLTSPTSASYSSERPRETFCYTQTVTITNTSPLNLSITLNRIVSAFKIVSTDNRPAEITKVRTTYHKGSKSFSPTSGLGLDDEGFSQINNPSTAVGAPIGVTSYVFLTSDEETMDVTIEALNNNNVVLYSKTLQNVTFKRNRMTKGQGTVFSTTSSAGFQLETDWLTDSVIGL